MKKNTLVILGHPDKDSFCGVLAKTYAESAKYAGIEVKEIEIGALYFDPVLWKGNKEIQGLEPDLVKAQELIAWAQHLVFVYPNWWGTIPAIMKGFFDRVFLPGFAFKYREKSMFWDKLLSGRSAHLIVTMDTPPWYYRWVYHMPGNNEMKRSILEFCGVKPVRITPFGPIKNSTQTQRDKWLRKVKKFGGTV